MRRASNPAITSRMYRHFATVTLMLTGAVALFANGENDPTTAAHAAEGHAIVREKPAKPALQPSNPAAGDTGTWGSDSSNGFGSPTLSAPSSDSEWMPSSLDGIKGLPRSVVGDNGDDDPAEAADQALSPAMPSAEEIAAAEAASRLRSGSTEGD
ncbi:MAG TPA: hypothetical protein VIC34_13000 [Croceibacterium sp.]|jgi:hypothetical protein